MYYKNVYVIIYNKIYAIKVNKTKPISSSDPSNIYIYNA